MSVGKRVRFTWALAGIALAVIVGAEPAGACSGPLVDARAAVDTAPAVVLVRVVGATGPEYERAYEFEVEESFKGRVRRRFGTEPLPYHACGDSINQPVGARLVIAVQADAFVGSPPLNPYWTVAADGRLSADGIDAEAVGWTTLDELRAGIGQRLGGLGIVEDAEPAAAVPVQPAGVGPPVVAVVTIAVGLVVLVTAAAVAGRRRGRA